ncbi:MAG: glycosyltransferase family 2 protein [Cyanobacteriota bacterium]|jgi:glycosyltransferase involved in cell wall biosynthesis
MSFTQPFKKTSLPSGLLSALVITFNEDVNIFRTLDSLEWIPEVLVIDSGSTDRTLEIVSSFRNTRVIYRKFDTFAKQCNFGLENLTSEWVLSLDADYILSAKLSSEIIRLMMEVDGDSEGIINGYTARFQYCINGKPIRSGVLPPRTILYRRICASYYDEGHGHRIFVNGKRSTLQQSILHDDRKPIGVWLMNQKRYLEIEAKNLIEQRDSQLQAQDLLRKHTCLAPFAVFLYCFILRGGFLDGKEGVLYAFQRFVAEAVLYLNLHTNSSRTQNN